MKFIGKMKIYIRKYIRKYIAVACSLFLIPLFSISSFAYTIPIDSVAIAPNSENTAVVLPMSNSGDAVVSETTYNFTNNCVDFNLSRAVNDIQYVKFVYGSGFTYTFNHDLYDYYVTLNLFYKENTSTLNISGVSLLYRQPFSASEVGFDTDVISTSKINVGQGNISQIISKVSDDFNNTIWGFLLWGNGNISGGSKSFTAYLHQVPKDTSTESVLSIISAINNQTSQLGSQLGEIDSGIDKGNDLIENGNEDTQSVLTDFNEVFEDFNQELQNWEDFDDDIISEFNAANDNYKTELNNFNLAGSLLDASTWLSTSMQTVYDNSFDYKMLWLVPLLFGIPILLFVIKKDKEEK